MDSTITYSVALTFVIMKVIDLTVGLRVDIEDETQELDVTSHGEVGYTV